ncbi:MAG: hypothetical protein P1V51_02935 [Deltaproteobacteria bacterium]|nr:hypothetical protein [Deltaproteobacteria bacterium]
MSRTHHRWSLAALFVALPALLSTGCFRGSGDDCEPGKKIACVCADDSAGTRTCQDDGSYADCDCGSPDGGTTDGGGTGCAAGWDLCGGVCVNVLDDPRTCGTCTNTCAVGEVCVGGNCETGADCRQEPCIGVTYCDEATGLCMPGCSQNGHCPPGEYCDLSVHACDCVPGTERCGLACVDTQTNPEFCGDCDTVCPATASCQSGLCECPGGTLICNGACVDILSDPFNCGICERTCDSRASCIGGDCQCPGSETLCNDVCVDTLSNRDHCNGCNRPCPTGEVCVSGVCEPPPDCRTDGCTGFTWCDTTNGVCMPGCGSDDQCRLDQTCQTSTHTCVCPAGQQDCTGTACVDTSSDASHCGACNRPCPGGQVCSGSTCIDPNQACLTYNAGNRLASCTDGASCTGDMECSLLGFTGGGACLDETPCGSTPAGPCCGAGEFCGLGNGMLGSSFSYFCCVPGESIPDGLFGMTCDDAGLEITCSNDADCPSAWGRGHCNTWVSPALCAECGSDAHCAGQRCNRSTGTCAECTSAADCPPATPVCDATGSCVSCRNDGDCGGATPACDNGSCVRCTDNFHCGGATPYCDTSGPTCVSCLSNSHCPGSAPVCDNGTCVVCPAGTTCQTLASGRRGCYEPPFFPFCQQDTDCVLFGTGMICDDAASGGSGLNCIYTCP